MKLTYLEALEAQKLLVRLDELTLPMATSLKIARLSHAVDKEVKIFKSRKDKLLNDYNIKPSHTDQEDVLSFSCETPNLDKGEKKSVLETWFQQFQELLDSETEELPMEKIIIPKGNIPDKNLYRPKSLKVLADFIEVV